MSDEPEIALLAAGEHVMCVVNLYAGGQRWLLVPVAENAHMARGALLSCVVPTKLWPKRWQTTEAVAGGERAIEALRNQNPPEKEPNT